MKKRLQGFIAGTLSGIILTSGIAIAANTTTLYDVMTNGIKIFVDGQKINPKDASGNSVEPFIYNGTTYLPVRAVADALGKAVYWDGPNYTVYLGKIDGELEYPTLTLQDTKNIGTNSSAFREVDNNELIDNYGNSYSNAIGCASNATFETLLNGKYSRFKGVLYVPQDYIVDKSIRITIEADGHQIYSSPQMNKTSRPIEIDLNISNYNEFKIKCYSDYSLSYNWECQALCVGNAGFYQ